MLGNSKIHWTKMEWVVPKSSNVKKNHYCTSYHKFFIKDKTPKNHWVGI